MNDKINMDRVVVSIFPDCCPSIYSFLDENETEDEALYKVLNDIPKPEYYLGLAKKFREKDDLENERFWENEAKKAKQRCFKVMSYDNFLKVEREFLLNGDLVEITEEKYVEVLDVLPPLKWCSINGVEEFCMREMYTSTYTNQYAYDSKTKKYYTKMVDCLDESTWIHNYLR